MLRDSKKQKLPQIQLLTQLNCEPATNSGIAVIGILYAIKAPIEPPAKIKIITKIKPVEKLPIDKNVTVIAIIIPKIPNKLPCLDVSGDDKPLKARINKTPKLNKKLQIDLLKSLFSFFFFYTSQHSLSYKKPTKNINCC